MALSALPRFLASRTFGRADVKASLWLIKHGISTSGPDLATDAGSTSFRRYAKYTVFKGKAALSLEPVLPTIREVDSQRSRVFKRGCVMLKFCPAIALQKYDWERRQVFALSPTEAGNLIALGPDETCEFLHDPSMKSSLEGQVKKSLRVSPSPNDKGYFLNLTVANKIQNTNERFSISVTKAEFAVIRNILTYVLPHILGWSQAWRPQVPLAASNLDEQFERQLDPTPKREHKQSERQLDPTSKQGHKQSDRQLVPTSKRGRYFQAGKVTWILVLQHDLLVR
ncbi:single-stranded DNA-binding protein WHY2, mitochondrial-like [Curcuma longa]|uniref:single-stranded DNA-binding protein WHY2, mitochondrial-like n=1 Tax=Curcuma longa TaxID=136217 RepID=UPI003D9F76F0